MQYKQQPSRIAAEEIESCTPWQLPIIEDGGLVVSTAEKEERERQEALRRAEQETIEDIELTEAPLPQTGISAQEMQEIFDAAEKDGFAQGHQAGFAKGEQEGLEAGRQQGLAEMRGQLQAEQQRFQQIAEALLQPLANQDSELESMLVDMVCSLTRAVVQRELQTTPADILSLTQQAVDALPAGNKELRILVNPDDHQPLQDYAQQSQLDWSAIADSRVSPGGCIVETRDSRVNFSVEQRLKTVLEQFRNKQLGAASDAEADPDPAAADAVDHVGYDHD